MFDCRKVVSEMGQAPRFKLYDAGKKYIGCLKTLEDCAAVIQHYQGGTIRDGHKKVLWTEGQEEQPAGESYDFCAEVCNQRIAGE